MKYYTPDSTGKNNNVICAFTSRRTVPPKFRVSKDIVLSGLNMSEQELTKWKNKFKLWMVLHNEKFPTSIIHCSSCKQCCRGGLFTDADGNITNHSEDYEGNYLIDERCIEWIKHV